MNNIKFMAVSLLTFLFLLSGVSANETAYELSEAELETVEQSMKALEDVLLNVRIDSNAWVEEGPSSSGPWERTPICLESTAYFGDISDSRAKLDINKIVLEWKDGAAPYLQKSCSVSFDGAEGRYKAISSSYNGKTFHNDSGIIFPNVPIQLKSDWYHKMTGIRASLFFHFRNNRAPYPTKFSSYFEALTDPNLDTENARVKFVYEELRGIQCIKMAFIGDSSRNEWWFDPGRGFALLRHDELGVDQDGNEQIKSSINVTKLQEVAENIWWPMEAYFVHCPRETDKPWERIVYRASNVVANAPNFDESIFTISFPEGYKIEDKVEGRTYTVGEK